MNGGPYRSTVIARSERQGDLHVRVTPAVAAIIIVAMLLVGLGWLSLVLTKTLPIESGLSLLTHLGVFLFGANVPLVQWFRAKKIRFDMTSDPPSGEGKDGNAGS